MTLLDNNYESATNFNTCFFFFFGSLFYGNFNACLIPFFHPGFFILYLEISNFLLINWKIEILVLRANFGFVKRMQEYSSYSLILYFPMFDAFLK